MFNQYGLILVKNLITRYVSIWLIIKFDMRMLFSISQELFLLKQLSAVIMQVILILSLELWFFIYFKFYSVVEIIYVLKKQCGMYSKQLKWFYSL